LAAALILLVPTVILLAPRTDWAAIPLGGWAALGWLAILSSLVGYALWFLAMDRAGIARIAVFQFAQPVLTVAAAVVLLDEPFTWRIALAAAAIVGGTVIAYRNAH
jgi:O-acetylserine/cysteine efflux transporter